MNKRQGASEIEQEVKNINFLHLGRLLRQAGGTRRSLHLHEMFSKCTSFEHSWFSMIQSGVMFCNYIVALRYMVAI